MTRKQPTPPPTNQRKPDPPPAPPVSTEKIKADIRALLTDRRYDPVQHLIIDGGISLRDYFAAMAIQGAALPANGELDRRPWLVQVEDVARAAYDIADAMLKAREK